MSEIIRLRESVEWKTVEDQILALDTGSSTFFNANRAGALLWSALAKGCTREQLVEELVEKYGIESETAQRDADTFLAALRKHGLLA